MITTATSKATINTSHHPLSKDMSTREKIMASTVSVDEYFDELINQVREDYATL